MAYITATHRFGNWGWVGAVGGRNECLFSTSEANQVYHVIFHTGWWLQLFISRMNDQLELAEDCYWLRFVHSS